MAFMYEINYLETIKKIEVFRITLNCIIIAHLNQNFVMKKLVNAS